MTSNIYYQISNIYIKENEMITCINSKYDSNIYNETNDKWESRRSNLLEEFNEIITYCYGYYMLKICNNLDIEKEVYDSCKKIIFQMISHHKDSTKLTNIFYQWEQAYIDFVDFVQNSNFSQDMIIQIYNDYKKNLS